MLAARDVSETQPSSGETWWITAVVAVGAALLGAAVGGVASFLANDRLEQRRRTARAAVRRRAKVYTPIRLELLALQAGMERDEHFIYGVPVTPPELKGFDRGPRVFRWREMKADGRASTAASARVRSCLDAVDESIDSFNEQRTAAMAVIDERGRALFEAVTGAPTTLVGWAHGNELVKAIHGRIEQTRLFGFGEQERAQRTADIDAFAEAFKADGASSAAIQRLTTVEDRLRQAVCEAVSELDRAMARIAERYEGEAPTD